MTNITINGNVSHAQFAGNNANQTQTNQLNKQIETYLKVLNEVDTSALSELEQKQLNELQQQALNIKNEEDTVKKASLYEQLVQRAKELTTLEKAGSALAAAVMKLMVL